MIMLRNRKNILIILVIIAITIISTTFLCYLFMNNNKLSNKIDDKKINNNINVDKKDDNDNIYIKEDSNVDNYSKEEVQNNNYNDNNNDSNIENDKDILIDPVAYFDNIENSSDENVIKEGFIKIVDFIFYGEKINGYTFEELTSEAKLKIINLALSLDKKVEEHFPGYKEKISNSTNKVYNNVKKFIVDLYVSITSEICENNEELCNYAKEDFEFMKKAFNITFDYIGNLSNIGIDKLEDWYENFKNK